MNILSSFLTLMSIHTCISSFLMLNTKSFWRTKQLLVPIENIFLTHTCLERVSEWQHFGVNYPFKMAFVHTMKVNGVQNTTDIFCLTAESKLIQVYNNTNLKKLQIFNFFFNFHFTELSWLKKKSI